MDYFKDGLGRVIIAIDHTALYYNLCKPDGNEIPTCSITLENLHIENNGGMKLFTIIELQVEIGIVSELDLFVIELCNWSTFLNKIISSHQSIVERLYDRLILLERQASGPVSGYRDLLYVTFEEQGFNLESSIASNLLPTEIIEYYGLGENDFWDQVQANGEFIEEEIRNIKLVEDFFNAVNSILTNKKQWDIPEKKIPWRKIIEALLMEDNTKTLGDKLELFLSERQFP